MSVKIINDGLAHYLARYPVGTEYDGRHKRHSTVITRRLARKADYQSKIGHEYHSHVRGDAWQHWAKHIDP
jgi:hypothetical protein